MDRAKIDEILRQTLHDQTLSRSERRALGLVLADLEPSRDDLVYLRHRAFVLADEHLLRTSSRSVLQWLEDVVKLLDAPPEPKSEVRAHGYFGPGDACPQALTTLLESARKAIDICVFTITDDRLTQSILGAHKRRVKVRIVTDDEKSMDLGSDIERMGRAGIPVRVDRTPFHMHHKFAIFDDEILVNGSYNWTRAAASENAENFLVTSDPRLVLAYRTEFARLWDAYT